MQQQAKPLPLDKTQELVCDKCANNKFVPVFFIRKISKFLSGTGQDALVPIDVFACHKCGHVNKDFLPIEMRNNDTVGSSK